MKSRIHSDEQRKSRCDRMHLMSEEQLLKNSRTKALLVFNIQVLKGYGQNETRRQVMRNKVEY